MPKEFDDVVNEVRLLFHVLVQSGEALHRRESVSMGQRAVLEFLDKNGPHTVPAIARARRVTRQHIQVLVNQLIEDGWVRTTRNEAHKRSSLVTMTAEGANKIGTMRRKEARHYGGLTPRIGRERLAQAAQTLRNLRSAIEE